MANAPTYFRLKNWLLPIWFLILLVIPFLNSQLGIIPDKETTDNRKLAEAPDLDINLLDPFPKAYEAYYRDNFTFRNRFIETHNAMNVFLFHRAPPRKSVLLGKDGWMYLMRRELETYRGLGKFKPEQLEQFRVELESRQKELAERNCTFLFCVVPTKYTVYPEYLPDYYVKFDEESKSDQVVDYLSTKSTVNLLDLRKVFLERKQKSDIPLFYKMDNHWNNYGAFVAQEAIVTYLKRFFPQMHPYAEEEISLTYNEVSSGNLSKIIRIDQLKETIPMIKYKDTLVYAGKERGYIAPKGFPYQNTYEGAYTTRNDSLPKLLLIRDSFGSYLMPYLAANFSESITIFDAWKYRYRRSIVEQENPDVVILLVLESFLHNLLAARDDDE